MMPTEPEQARLPLEDTLTGIHARAHAALLAFAAGDALGWPQEMRQSRPKNVTPGVAFQRWVRRAGGRFYAHDETIEAGEYSDDTQMTLAVARARLSAKDWWACLSQRELPLFTVYNRGAGGSMLRAAAQWRRGTKPWEATDAEQLHSYFQSGANGAAMRMLPHAIWHALSGDSTALAADVLCDTLLTHGHPRAAIGARLYAQAALTLLRTSETLRYGDLIEQVLADRPVWGVVPRIPIEGWLQKYERSGASFSADWEKTVEETTALLGIAREGLARGALADDREVLQRLGCFSRTKGSGTTTTAAVVYVASRYAAQPRAGVLASAFAIDADTDTLGAMTAGLLGGLGGPTWLPTEWLAVQDAECFRVAAHDLLRQATDETWKPFREADVHHVTDALSAKSKTVSLGGALSGSLVSTTPLSFRGTAVATVWKVALSTGQTIYVKKMSPKTKAPSARAKKENDIVSPTIRSVRIVVRDLQRSARFYGEVLGIRATGHGHGTVLLGPVELVSRSSADMEHVTPEHRQNHALVLVIVGDVDEVGSRADEHQVPAVARSGDAADDRWVRYRDPDGNLIEVRERRS